MLPIEHGENVVVFLSETGDMIYAASASHVVLLKGQQLCDNEHPSEQSCTMIKKSLLQLKILQSLVET